MYGLKLRSAIAVWLVMSCSVAHARSVADYRIDTGDSIADQWVWMNASGDEVLANSNQIFSTRMDLNSGSLTNLKGSLAIIFMPTSGALAGIGVSSLTEGDISWPATQMQKEEFRLYC